MSIKSSLIVLTMCALSPVALAQSDTTSQSNQNEQQQTGQQAPAPDTGSMQTQDQTAPGTASTQDAESGASGQNTAEQPSDTAGQSSDPLENQIVLQSENTILSHELLGAPVYTANDEQVGDINDMIINLDGTVDGVVIGVGGFLGIGEKEVAVKMDAISVTPLQDGSVQLLLSTTREELEAAPAFKSSSQQQAEQQVESARQR
ncbi:MAG: PRC-barrel domain-containing protein, partial [Anderseniella sp.]|nr:PRC-barrel domain-containing protein [Anderseniella sp.]